jgi:hypothetical protein
MHYTKLVSLELLFVLLCSWIKPGSGATGYTKKVGRRPDPKFDVYTQISSNLQSKLKNQSQIKITVELKMFIHFVKFW